MGRLCHPALHDSEIAIDESDVALVAHAQDVAREGVSFDCPVLLYGGTRKVAS